MAEEKASHSSVRGSSGAACSSGTIKFQLNIEWPAP